MIDHQPDMLLVSQASSGMEAIQQFREHRPDITLMDLRLPDLSGIDAMITIRQEFPHARIVMLTTFEGDLTIQRALEAGARGYLLKSAAPKEMVEVIRQVHAGKKRISPDVAAHLASHVGDESLTNREIGSVAPSERRQSQQGHRGVTVHLRRDGESSHEACDGQAGGQRPHAGDSHCGAARDYSVVRELTAIRRAGLEHGPVLRLRDGIADLKQYL